MRITKTINLGIWGLVDPILNSLNYHHNNCMILSKENYKFGLGVKGLNKGFLPSFWPVLVKISV